MAVFYVGAGGAVGAVLRYLLTRAIPSARFPFATLAANVIAGFLIGFAVGLDGTAFEIPPKSKLVFNTGLLGGLSTFSTFSLETVRLFQDGKALVAAVYAAVSLLLALLCAALGMAASKLIVRQN
ncbi:MAG: fluoride efflux transporter CrcB [Oscillospiraceae bacterium]|jgi:CrcB protein|nr:fluoride efflux transporter CrcB [Oscillospiraceae bacterium]